MGYSKNIYESAQRSLDLLRRQTILENKERRILFFKRFPRAQEIEVELCKTAVRIAKAILNGSDVELKLQELKNANLILQQELRNILKQARLPNDYLDIQYKCSKCNDEGYVDGVMCSCMKKILRNEAYERLNRLSPLSLSTFESFSTDCYSSIPLRQDGPSPKKRMEDILKFCKNYAENFSVHSPSILMQGSTGLGKTHLSLAIAKKAIDKNYGVIYGSTPNILSKLEKERFSYNKNKDFDESENYLIDCDLLILDDLGTEYSTAFSNATVYNIINSRIMSNKPTIINTNLSMKDLEKAYSERLVSRIMGNHTRLEFLGKDIRQSKITSHK